MVKLYFLIFTKINKINVFFKVILRKSSRKNILTKLSQVISWRIIFGNNKVFSIISWCKPKSYPLRSSPNYLCKMASFRTKIRIPKIIKFDLIIPGLSGITVLVISWWRAPHIIKILSVLSITVMHLSNLSQVLSPHLSILVELFINLKWRNFMLLS